LSVNVLNK